MKFLLLVGNTILNQAGRFKKSMRFAGCRYSVKFRSRKVEHGLAWYLVKTQHRFNAVIRSVAPSLLALAMPC
ncbi:hypothetical protein BVG84_11425 [Serratia marcescens]|nr:hypothetical protein BVG84_11425 [Serratia marcescens]